jgi:hypothetical protein
MLKEHFNVAVSRCLINATVSSWSFRKNLKFLAKVFDYILAQLYDKYDTKKAIILK